MSSLIFAHAKSIYNKTNKHVSQQRDLAEAMGDAFDASATRTKFIERERTKFRDILEIAKLLHEDYQQVTKLETSNYYFISVRPRPSVTFEDFYKLTYKYVNRAFMISYKLSFEQKSIDGDGSGFHAHVVCSTKHRSKGECLRDTISSFRKVCEENCIDVQVTRNPEDIVNNYLLNYKSEDEHKSPTREGDQIWRNKLGLADLYDNDLPMGCLSSPGTALKRVEPFCTKCSEYNRYCGCPIVIEME